MRFPVIDLSQPREEVVGQIKTACQDLGFFQVINHGIATGLIEGAREAGRQFFALPLEKKKEYPLTFKGGELFGYAALGAESADVANLSLTGKEAIPDLMESFQVGDIDLVKNKYALDIMKDNLEPLYAEQRKCALHLLGFVSEALGMPKDYLPTRHDGGQHRSVLRVTRYPALKAVDGLKERGKGISRISPHRDLGSITLLFQDNQGGLEVQEGDKWIPVDPVDGAIVVNIGNILTRWSNKTFKSSIHRVITNENSDDNDRYSVIMFVNPRDDVMFGPLPNCVPEGEKPKYEEVEVGKYMSCKLTQLFDPDAREQKGYCKYDD